MTVETFMMLLTALSFITSITTEAVKKVFETKKMEYASNIIVLVVAILVGGMGTSIFYFLNGFAFDVTNIITVFLMMFANWLVAMVGYDKVLQAIKQIQVGKGV